NVPAVPLDQLAGLKVTRLGKRHPSEPVVRSSTPYGEPVYWIGPAGGASDFADDTDFGATQQSIASITPLRLDLTHYDQLPQIEGGANPVCVGRGAPRRFLPDPSTVPVVPAWAAGLPPPIAIRAFSVRGQRGGRGLLRLCVNLALAKVSLKGLERQRAKYQTIPGLIRKELVVAWFHVCASRA